MFISRAKGRKAPSARGTVRLRLEALEDRCVLSTAYLATDLVSDQTGVAALQDKNLVNAWGLSLSPTGGAFWVSSTGKDISTLYTGDVGGGGDIKKNALEVSIPKGAPTGQVFNTTNDFTVSNGTTAAKSVFIFASEAGTVTGWNPTVAPNTTAKLGFQATDGAVYKGIALANNGTANFLYVADFHNGKIDVLDTNFHRTHLDGSFTDPNLPKGFAPFNVAAINGKLYVTYAKQDADKEDDVAGPGNGFIDVFDTNGHMMQRLVSRGRLNSPWGMVLAPASFGDFGGDLLVGNFGNGRINAFNPDTGKFLGTLSEAPGKPLVIDGLWGLSFGNGSTAGDTGTLYFTAGPDDEAHGLFGKITANPAGTNPVQAALKGSDLIITGSRDDDKVSVSLDRAKKHILVRAGGQMIGTFDTASAATIRFSGLAGDDVIKVDKRVTAATILDGGAGDDVLNGGGGSNILLGGTGNDVLRGGHVRDVLIGGEGRDRLFGKGDDDILIGGSTASDGNQATLVKILAAWNAIDSYANRVDALRRGTGGVPRFDSTLLIDDGVVDDLFGGPGLDWFIRTLPDRVHDAVSAEQFN